MDSPDVDWTYDPDTMFHPRVEETAFTHSHTRNNSNESGLRNKNHPLKRSQTWSENNSKRQNLFQATFKKLSPTPQHRIDEFRHLFKDVPAADELLETYSCALYRDMLVHGRMYISNTYLCFYASILSWEISISLPFKDIAAIERRNTALVIPNSLKLFTVQGDSYLFTSFTSRERAYSKIHKIWRLNSLELHREIPDTPDTTSMSDDTNSVSQATAKSEFTFPDVVNASLLGEPKVCSTHHSRNPSETVADDSMQFELARYEELNGNCLCEEHKNTDVIDKVFSLPASQVFECLFTNSDFYVTQQTKRKTSNIRATQWEVDENGIRSRTLNYNISVNHPMAPKSSGVEEKQYLSRESKDGYLYTINTEVNNFGIPYADTFYAVSTYCISRISDTHCRLRIHTGIVYKKKCWGLVKTFIDRNSLSQSKDYFSFMAEALEHELPDEGHIVNGKLAHATVANINNPRKASVANTIYYRCDSRLSQDLGRIDMPENESTAVYTVVKLVLFVVVVLSLLCLFQIRQLNAIEHKLSLTSLERSCENPVHTLTRLADQIRTVHNDQHPLELINLLTDRLSTTMESLKQCQRLLRPAENEGPP